MRGICEKYQSSDETFPEPKGRWNLVSRLVFFGNTPHNMIYLFNYTEYYLEHWLNKKYLLFVVFRNILFLLFITWQLLNTIWRFELFPSAGTVVVFRFVMSDSGWSIPNEFGGLRHARVKKLNPLDRTTSGFQIWLITLPYV